jgi:glycosyltransferase involved in cell wall biosynthesis
MERHRRLLYVGQVTRRKGAEALRETGPTLLGRHPQAMLSVVTDERYHEVVRRWFNPMLLDRVRLLPWMPQEALRQVYDDHGIQMIPSLYEGAGKAHYEGMARRLCVVGYGVGALRDSIVSGETGRLVDAGENRQLIRILSDVIGNYEAARFMAENARKRSEEFTWRRTATEVASFAAELIKNSHGSRDASPA